MPAICDDLGCWTVALVVRLAARSRVDVSAPDHITPWWYARRSFRDEARLNKDSAPSLRLGGGQHPASHRANDFDC